MGRGISHAWKRSFDACTNGWKARAEYCCCGLDCGPDCYWNIIPCRISSEAEVFEAVEPDYRCNADTGKRLDHGMNNPNMQKGGGRSQATHAKHGIHPEFLHSSQLHALQFLQRQNHDQNVLQYVESSVGPCGRVVINALPSYRRSSLPGE